MSKHYWDPYEILQLGESNEDCVGPGPHQYQADGSCSIIFEDSHTTFTELMEDLGKRPWQEGEYLINTLPWLKLCRECHPFYARPFRQWLYGNLRKFDEELYRGRADCIELSQRDQSLGVQINETAPGNIDMPRELVTAHKGDELRQTSPSLQAGDIGGLQTNIRKPSEDAEKVDLKETPFFIIQECNCSAELLTKLTGLKSESNVLRVEIDNLQCRNRNQVDQIRDLKKKLHRAVKDKILLLRQVEELKNQTLTGFAFTFRCGEGKSFPPATPNQSCESENDRNIFRSRGSPFRTRLTFGQQAHIRRRMASERFGIYQIRGYWGGYQ